MKEEYVQVVTTTANRRDAERIAAVLLEGRLAACVQISGPVASRYRWKGRQEKAREFTCAAKTRGMLYRRVEKAIRACHPYEVPEIVALPIVAGDPDYLEWVTRETKQKKGKRS